jgi:hypothetical protein
VRINANQPLNPKKQNKSKPMPAKNALLFFAPCFTLTICGLM